ncbi:PAS domain-containing sensor histidine kinase [Shewanella dokdonensis]|uniref:PAS domain-containing sensor histidine kinase n=1 Tax=Shewanella dokdonensis TaxID=712036 RepID=UPI0024B17ED1|nr:PAS domain S-box protein [Shewanella dokdonensis]
MNILAGFSHEGLLQDRYNNLLISHERYRAMFDNIPLAYMSMDENAAIIDFNNAFSELTGYSYEEVYRKPFAFFLYDKKDVEYHINVTFPRFKRKGLSRNQPWKLKHKSGREIYVIVHGNVRYDNDGHFIQTHCLIVDVTEQRLAREECQRAESKAQLILDVISERVTFHDRAHHILWANKNARSNATNAGIPTQQSCVNEQDSCDKCPVNRVFKDSKAAFGEVQVQGRLLQVSAYPVVEDNGELSGVVQVARDITEQRNLEIELLRLSTNERRRIGGDLHDGVGQELTGLSFLASAMANQLQGRGDPLSELADKIVETVGRARQRMYNVLQGLSHVPEGPDGLTKALSSLQQSVQDLYDIDCYFQQPQAILLDDDVISAHLFNIASEAVSNAMKYSQCSQLLIALEQQGHRLLLKVQDNGCGIADAGQRRGAMGLKIMQYRATMIGGELKVETGAQGTCISCDVALTASHNGANHER